MIIDRTLLWFSSADYILIINLQMNDDQLLAGIIVRRQKSLSSFVVHWIGAVHSKFNLFIDIVFSNKPTKTE